MHSTTLHNNTTLHKTTQDYTRLNQRTQYNYAYIAFGTADNAVDTM